MNINKETDLIKILGWTQTSKILYIIKQLNDNKSKDDIYRDLVEDNKLMKSKSFQNYWNQIKRIRDNIEFV